jgi:uncharacterized membrane protein YgcG
MKPTVPCRRFRSDAVLTMRRQPINGPAAPAGRWLGLVLAALVFAAAPVIAGAAEIIERFDAQVDVAPSGNLTVTETIRVRAEGNEIKRGIYRDFPLTFLDDKNRRRQVTFKLLEVSRDGEAEPHFTRRNAAGIRIYAGEESVFLKPGTYTYRLRYRTGRQIRFLPDHDELYWNVTGNEWAFPIRSATATIRLPQDAAPLRWTAYTGSFGARGRDWSGEVSSAGTLRVATTRPLAAGHGLSVVAEIPPGLVARPSGLMRLYYALLDYRRFILGGLGLIGVLAYYLTAWNAVGRDPPKGTIIPLFHPPEGISPALAGYIREWGWSGGWREFTAAAISLAVRGLLVFDDSDGDLTLSRTATPAAKGRDHLPPGERAVLSWVEGHGGTARIDKANGESVASIFSTFKSSVEHENRHRFFRRNLGYFLIGAALTAITIIAVLVFGNLGEAEIGILIATAIACGVIGMMVMPLVRVVMGGRNLRTIIAAGINLAVVGFMGSMFFSLVASSGASLPEGFSRSIFNGLVQNSFPFVLIGGFAALNGLFFYLLRAPTAAGRVIMDQIEGLELYLRTAETERMNMIGAPDLTTETFERLLPYAIALEAEKPWSQAFSAAFARAHPGEAVTTAYRPAWHGGRGWSGRDFGRSMSSAMSSAQSAFTSAMPAPKSSSSGFSGGGGSGGGGGGGGGGGW